MLSYIEKHQGYEFTKSESFYCGDAAGRPATANSKKDHSADDLKFASNIKVKFHTPESLFLGQPMTGVQSKLVFTLKQPETKSKEAVNQVLETAGCVIKNGKPGDELLLTKDRPLEVIIFVGSPGSGKSTFWKTYFSSYERVNNDTLKTPPKCLKACSEFLAQKKSVVIDNTNSTKHTRRSYLQLCSELDVPARCIFFSADKKVCMHNNFMRKVNTFRKHLSGSVPAIALHIFFKNLEVPTREEGFEAVIEVQFVLKFENEQDRECYEQMQM